MIIFRELSHEDYKDILDISKDVWEGSDYLPEVFHQWVDDKGVFLGCIDVLRNKVVAVGKLSILSDKSGWMEGLRVHIDYRGQKLGRKISEELIRIAKTALIKGEINKIALSTHLNNIESKALMEKLNFKSSQVHTLAIKNIEAIDPELTLNNFEVKAWDVNYEEFINHPYISRRKGLLPLAFVFEEITTELFEKLKDNHSFVMINGHTGIFKYKGEPNFIAMEDTFEAIDTFMNYHLLKYKDKGISEIYTPIMPEDKKLIERFKSSKYISWSDWEPDYLYYVYEEPSK
jgi:ribosomal protein S18 acetylase RimI-like enzyme